MLKQEKNGKSADDLPTEAAAQAAAQAETAQIKVRVLVDCHLGKVNDVVTLDAESVSHAQAHGLVDAAPEAVAYAESIVTE